MFQTARHRPIVWIAFCLVLLACGSDGEKRGMADENRSAAAREDSFSLDLTNRSVTMPIGPELGDAASARFVEVDIAEVLNPKKLRLTFEVHYQPKTGQKLELGSFALFPPDNPGKFIVATRGRLRSGGAIVLSMLVLDEVAPEDRVRVEVRQISFRQ